MIKRVISYPFIFIAVVLIYIMRLFDFFVALITGTASYLYNKDREKERKWKKEVQDSYLIEI